MDLTCSRCGVLFTPKRKAQKRCSRQCNGRARDGAEYTKAAVFQCEHCGKETVRRRFRFADGRPSGHDYGQRFCSKKCGYAGRAIRPTNPNGYVHSTGYIRVDLPHGRKDFQHRLVMSQMLGRAMRKNENVHHRNGQKTDNRPENLELWSKAQPPGQRVIDKIDFAIEMIQVYPEFAAAKGFKLVPI